MKPQFWIIGLAPWSPMGVLIHIFAYVTLTMRSTKNVNFFTVLNIRKQTMMWNQISNKSPSLLNRYWNSSWNTWNMNKQRQESSPSLNLNISRDWKWQAFQSWLILCMLTTSCVLSSFPCGYLVQTISTNFQTLKKKKKDFWIFSVMLGLSMENAFKHFKK